MIPSNEVTLLGGSSAGTGMEDDSNYLLEIGCKVFEVNKIRLSGENY